MRIGSYGMSAIAMCLLSISTSSVSAQEAYGGVHFSPNGKYVGFNRCTPGRIDTCHGIVFDTATNRFFSFRDSGGKRVTNIAWSQNGGRAAFVLHDETSNNGGAPAASCLAMLDISTRQYRLGPCGDHDKRHLEFVSDTEVVYFQSETRTKRRPPKHLMIFDFSAMSERQIVGDSFFGPSKPVRARDIRSVVFSDYGYRNRQKLKQELKFPKEDPSDDLLTVSITDQTIALIDVNVPKLITPKFMEKSGNVFFLKRESSLESGGFIHDVYAIHPGANSAERITRISAYIASFDVSPDEKLLIIAKAEKSRANANEQLMLYEISTNKVMVLAPAVIEEMKIEKGREG